MLGRHRQEGITEEQARLVRLEAAINQTLMMLRAATKTNTANRDLVDLALDANNLLQQGLARP